MTPKRLLVILVVGCVLVSGCTGTGPATDGDSGAQGGNGNQETASASGQSGSADGGQDGGSQGSGSSSSWCPAGQTTSFANPQTGEQASMTVQGVVTHEGRQVCKAVWESSGGDGQVAKMEVYFTEDESYRKVVTYDAEGNVVNEMQMAGSTGSDSGGSSGQSGSATGTDAGDGGTGDQQWCVEGESFQFSNPQTGEQASMVYEGIVTHEGRQVCKAVWETNDPDGNVAKVEMYFNEDRSYQKTIYYDGNGNVVFEQEQGSG